MEEYCMDSKNLRVDMVLVAIVGMLVCMAALYVIPWKNIVWGKVKLSQGDFVTVVGEAKTKQKNQKATFSAGVNAISDNKDSAIADVNKKISAIIESVKAFGVSAEDIKTQNLNVYQNEETYYEDGRQKARPGQWRVSNTVEITLVNVDFAQDLTGILTKSGATNIYGPNFVLDETGATENSLVDEAVKNAREKAAKMATAANKKLGSITSMTEGYQTMPVYRMESGGGGGGGGIEPGTGTVTKTITVTFELLP